METQISFNRSPKYRLKLTRQGMLDVSKRKLSSSHELEIHENVLLWRITVHRYDLYDFTPPNKAFLYYNHIFTL